MHMSFKKALKHYKTVKAIKDKFGFSYQRMTHWSKSDVIPQGPAYQLYIESGGKLKLIK